VREVAPLIPLRPVPGTPDYVAGLANYRGRPTPVVDMCRVLGGKSARRLLSTRILFTAYPPAGEDGVLGLLAEQATQTLERDPDAFEPPGLKSDGAPYLGPVLVEDDRVVQCVRPEDVLPEEVAAMVLAGTRTGEEP
jgi:chemotaxis-related protein WspB